MQQDNSNLSNSCESKLYCEVHPESELQILHFGEKSKRKSRMLCVYCIIESNNERENLCQFVHIQKFVNDPKNTLLQIINIEKVEGWQNVSTMLDEIDKLMLSFEETIKSQLIKIKENIQQMRKQVQQIGEELSNELKLNDVVKQIQLLKQMDSCQGTSELTNLDNQLNFISENLNKSYLSVNNKSIDNQLKTAYTLLDNLQIIQNDIESTSKKCRENLAKVNLFGSPVDIKDFPQIHQQISEGKKIYYQLLYSSARDGLNGQAYWAKCDMQQNLLTIMTSKNGSKFGGYSPCQINQQLGTYVQDPTMKSFIFQYNKKELYKLKVKEYAVRQNPSYGPTYGNCDIYVNTDFQDGQSHNLGSAYDISSYNIVDKANHIFGATTPQLQELIVYKNNFFLVFLQFSLQTSFNYKALIILSKYS
ncbi:hypothetical protein pb186bvf_015561 [Paramecium bursaria]